MDSAWKIHAAVADWTARVDAKASFALASESAAIGIILKLREASGPFHQLPSTTAQALFWVGILTLSTAIGFCLWVVTPRLRSRHLLKEAPHNYIYFGHLRHWDPAALQEKLAAQDLLTPLCTNIVNASKVAWAKHRCVQTSLVLTLPSAACFISAAALAR